MRQRSGGITGVVQQLLDARLVDLASPDTADNLRGAVAELNAVIQSLNAFLVQGSDSSAPSAKPRLARSKRGLGKTDFSPTPFVIDAVKRSRKTGISVGELIAMLDSTAPGRYAKPRNLVSPLLHRLKTRGLVKNRGGRWYTVTS